MDTYERWKEAESFCILGYLLELIIKIWWFGIFFLGNLANFWILHAQTKTSAGNQGFKMNNQAFEMNNVRGLWSLSISLPWSQQTNGKPLFGGPCFLLRRQLLLTEEQQLWWKYVINHVRNLRNKRFYEKGTDVTVCMASQSWTHWFHNSCNWSLLEWWW
jgi:hypothetical protein